MNFDSSSCYGCFYHISLGQNSGICIPNEKVLISLKYLYKQNLKKNKLKVIFISTALYETLGKLSEFIRIVINTWILLVDIRFWKSVFMISKLN